MHDQAVRPAARSGGPGFGHMHLRGLPHYAALNYLSPGRTACAVMPFQGTGNVPSPRVTCLTTTPGTSTEKAEAEPEAIGPAQPR